jgi:hypothetical protein
MIAVPTLTPETVHEPEVEAISGWLDVHVPPATAQLNVVVRFLHSRLRPVIDGAAFTVINLSAMQPFAAKYTNVVLHAKIGVYVPLVLSIVVGMP